MHLNFHDIVTMDLGEAPAGVRDVLAGLFPHFVDSGACPADPGVVFVPGGEEEDRLARMYRRGKQVERFQVLPGRDGLAVLAGRSRRPGAVLVPGEPLVVRTMGGAVSSGLLFDVAMLALELALERRGGMMFKAAAAVRDGRAVVLTGTSGAGKTTLLLGLLESGWDYLSNNMLILHGGRAHLLERQLVFHLHHAVSRPEVFSRVSRLGGRLRWAGVRLRLRDRLRAGLPLPLTNSYKFRRIFDPFLTAMPEELFPGRAVLDGADTAAWIMLVPGTSYSMRPLGRDDAVRRFGRIMALSCPDWASVRDQRILLGDAPGPSFAGLLSANLRGACHAATLPPGMDARDLDAACLAAMEVGA